MSEIKYTPGPWYWDDRYPASEGRKTWSLIGADGYGILSCDGEENSPQGLNDHANGRLIAAAPDLLEALVRLNSLFTVGVDARLDDALSSAREAIAKARSA